jgi:serine/threonine-protein kinase HipA
MGRAPTKRALSVYMNGVRVGTLNKYATGKLSFQYEDSWLNHELTRSISLSLPLGKRIYEGDVVFNFFENLLPDSNAIRTRIQQRFGVSSNQPFDLLEAIGRDCVGALQICNDEHRVVAHAIEGDPLDESSLQSYLQQYHTAPLGMRPENDDFRMSLAGAQEKTALLWYKDSWWIPKAATPTTHIIKLPIGMLQHHNIDLSRSCENEWLCLKIADSFGLRTAKAELMSLGKNKVLVVERFDREWSHDQSRLIRLPQEDMCQALGYSPHIKYQSDGGPGVKEIMELLLGSERALQDRETFLRTIVLFWILAAPDGHAKNFSIRILRQGRYNLTPIYDVLSAYAYTSNDYPFQKIKMAMAMTGSNKNHYHWHYMQPRHFAATAKQAGFSSSMAIIILKEMLEKSEFIAHQVESIIPSGFHEETAAKILKGMVQQAHGLLLQI